MTIDKILDIISKNGSITSEPLRDLVIMVVLEALAIEREEIVRRIVSMGDEL